MAKVLYVDDDKSPALLRAMARLLKPEGAEVDLANSLASGLALAKQKDYDLFILDGLEGKCWDFGREFPASQEKTVIFSSNNQVIAAAQRLGVFYVEKPEYSQVVDFYRLRFGTNKPK